MKKTIAIAVCCFIMVISHLDISVNAQSAKFNSLFSNDYKLQSVDEKNSPYTEFSVQKINDLTLVTVDVFNLDSECVVVLSAYKEDKLADIYSDVYSGKTISFILYDNYDSLKVILIESFDSLRPLCKTNTTPIVKSYPSYLATETIDTVMKTEKINESDFTFVLFSDVHNSTNENRTNWKDTVLSIKTVNYMLPIDAVFSLGDQIDGNASKNISQNLLKQMRNEMNEITENSIMLTGNHDTNDYFDKINNTDRITVEDRNKLYGIQNNPNAVTNGLSNYGYYDVDELKIRVIMLDALESNDQFGTNMTTMGYSNEQVEWVREVALNTDYHVIFFSHIGVSGNYNYNRVQPVNGVKLRNIIENFISNGGIVVGLFHGHTHWDYIDKFSNENGFYEISIASSNCSKTLTPDVEAAVCPNRKRYTTTQELWDLVIINPVSRSVKMIRFGAGDDRSFSY